uniref:Uncharacterized protein n=1 Tax=Grammatophora oceanica TaxID=210454 RepID=A0A7S1Y3D6_9STRA|mmetsp:Transcript_15807/g.23301  ORF Transcript_15807/g.23301 Transcript_15807/m.23301 type:complete len:131 (+) Transcript_15807:302-694(+)
MCRGATYLFKSLSVVPSDYTRTMESKTRLLGLVGVEIAILVVSAMDNHMAASSRTHANDLTPKHCVPHISRWQPTSKLSRHSTWDLTSVPGLPKFVSVAFQTQSPAAVFQDIVPLVDTDEDKCKRDLSSL